MAAQKREKIRGTIVRFSLSCRHPDPKLHNDIALDPTDSCLTFKANGNLTSKYHTEIVIEQ